MLYFDSKVNTPSDTCKPGNLSNCQYGWLYDRTSINCTLKGCPNDSDVFENHNIFGGYWSSQKCEKCKIKSYFAITQSARISQYQYDCIYNMAIRPVIEVSKESLNIY